MADTNTDQTAEELAAEETAAEVTALEDARKLVADAEDDGDDKGDDKAGADGKGDGKKTDVLLSGDEDKGEGGVPDEYVYTPPEGVEIDDAAKEGLLAFGETARGMQLSQAQYQGLVEFDNERSLKLAGSNVDAYQARIDGWADEIMADKELGGDDLKETLRIAVLAQDVYGSKELGEIFQPPSEDNPNGLGIGSHPAIVKLFNRIGRAMDEDKLEEGEGTTPLSDDARLRRLYPTMFPKEE
jgi:hypothetical protein